MRANYAHKQFAITHIAGRKRLAACNAGGTTMRHCCQFKADEIYYLEENAVYTDRILSIGFCPICQRPVAELIEHSINGAINKTTLSGMHAQNLVMQLKDQIIYADNDVNYRKLRGKPFGWKYGKNKECNNGKVRQYACDFYGNKELIKEL